MSLADLGHSYRKWSDPVNSLVFSDSLLSLKLIRRLRFYRSLQQYRSLTSYTNLLKIEMFIVLERSRIRGLIIKHIFLPPKKMYIVVNRSKIVSLIKLFNIKYFFFTPEQKCILPYIDLKQGAKWLNKEYFINI